MQDHRLTRGGHALSERSDLTSAVVPACVVDLAPLQVCDAGRGVRKCEVDGAGQQHDRDGPAFHRLCRLKSRRAKPLCFSLGLR